MTVLSATTLEPVMVTPFTAMISFGDSFTDNGFVGGHGFRRYTNTWTWAEYLSQLLGLPYDSWSHGGAMSDDRNQRHPPGVRWSGLAWQVKKFTEGLTEGDDVSKVLFTVACGSNDYWGGQRSGQVSADNMKAAMEVLAKAGARHLIYRESSAILLAPGYLEGEFVPDADGWRKLVDDTNVAARKVIQNDFAREYPEVKLLYLQSDPLFLKIKNCEPGYTFEIIDKKWFDTYDFPAPYKYLWWDEYHLMGQAHLLIAQDTLESLKVWL